MSARETPALDELQAAVALYRAPLLDGLTLSEAPDFEVWLTIERERFGQMVLQALEKSAALHRAAGDWAAVKRVARQALAHDALQDPMHRALMETQARIGERPATLRQYDHLQTILRRGPPAGDGRLACGDCER